MEAILDILIDANLVLVIAFSLWLCVQALLSWCGLKSDYTLQLRLMRAVLVFVLLSPFLSFLVVSLSQSLWPHSPITLGDMAVAAYLRGEIAMPALQFEQLLNARGRVVDQFIAGELPWLTALAAVLAAGAILHGLRIVRTGVAIRRILSRSYVWRRTARTDIRFSDCITVPFATRGILRRHVVLPSSLLTSPADLKIVLVHEFEHLRQGDVEWELIFEFLRPLLYYNPVFHLWRRASNRMRELNCDQSVMEQLGLDPRHYAECLLRFCQPAPARAVNVSAMNVALLGSGVKGRAALEDRLLALRVPRSAASGPSVFAAICVVLAAGIILAAGSVRNPIDWSQDRLMLSTIVNLERLEAINGGS